MKVSTLAFFLVDGIVRVNLFCDTLRLVFADIILSEVKSCSISNTFLFQSICEVILLVDESSC